MPAEQRARSNRKDSLPARTIHQLAWLVKLAELDNVTFQTVRDSDRPVAGGGFTILSFLEDRFEDVVYVEQLHGLSWLEAADERAPYEQTITEAKRMALAPEESVESVAKALTSQE